MFRTQIYLTQEEREGLKKLSRETGKKQAQLIREAVDTLLYTAGTDRRASVIRETAGLWKDREDLPDPEELRSSWDRE